MTRFEVLNNVAHKDLRIATDFGPEYGDAIGMVAALRALGDGQEVG
jgi:hypothetical protein